MSRLLGEQPIALADAAKLLPKNRSGKAVHVATLYRWAARGHKGVRLEIVRLGGRVYTSAAALERFIARCSAGGRAVDTPAKPGRKTAGYERAARELAAAGIG